jgi:hypothetical protein
MNFLMVETESTDIFFAQRAFSKLVQGELHVVPTDLEAMELIEAAESGSFPGLSFPDGVICDLGSLIRSDFEFIRWARAHSSERISRLPLLVAGEVCLGKFEHKAMQLGATECVIKPVNWVQIVKITSACLSSPMRASEDLISFL